MCIYLCTISSTTYFILAVFSSYSFWCIIYIRYTFSSNHNIHKNLCSLCFWAPDPLIDIPILLKIYPLKGLSGATKTKATWTFMNVVIWRKRKSNVHILVENTYYYYWSFLFGQTSQVIPTYVLFISLVLSDLKKSNNLMSLLSESKV